MFDAKKIRAGMEVVDTHGGQVGIVDHVQGDIVELRREGFADTLHHFVPLAAVRAVKEERLLVEPGVATTVEAVAAAISYAHAHPTTARRGDNLFGTSGQGTGFGGSGAGH